VTRQKRGSAPPSIRVSGFAFFAGLVLAFVFGVFRFRVAGEVAEVAAENASQRGQRKPKGSASQRRKPKGASQSASQGASQRDRGKPKGSGRFLSFFKKRNSRSKRKTDKKRPDPFGLAHGAWRMVTGVWILDAQFAWHGWGLAGNDAMVKKN